ncbi:MAG: serine protease [Calditrichaeota bacterium]|nr:MAG: serine protease [Calditrichota bacterium]
MFLCFLIGLSSCTPFGRQKKSEETSRQNQILPFPENLTKAIQEILPSVVEVAAIVEYRVEEYQYELQNGRYIRDPASPVGYRLVKHDNKPGIVTSKANTKAFGAGLVIGLSTDRILILTSRHIVVQEDTLTDYIYLNNHYTDIPRTRAFLKRNELGVRGVSNTLRAAELFAENARWDLALITAARRDFIGTQYVSHIAQKFEQVWGRFAVVVGYPNEIKQVAMGLTGDSPYPGNFSVGIHGDFGFSGGPVFLFDSGLGLSLIGVGKSVPGKKVFFVTPDSSLRFRTRLHNRDIPHLQVEEMAMLAPHRIYAVQIYQVLRFIREHLDMIERRGYKLSPEFYDAVQAVESDGY